MITYTEFIHAITPLLCENICGSPTYGIIEERFGRNVIVCGGCGHVQSSDYQKYLNTKQYAIDFIKNISENIGTIYEPEQLKNWKKCFIGKLKPMECQ